MSPSASRVPSLRGARSVKHRNGARILVVAVSHRLDSATRKLARLAEETARGMWVDATLVDSADYPLPLCECDPGSQKAPPPNVLRLNQMIQSHQGMIIVTPEKNRSIPAVLKNTLEWLAVPEVNPDVAQPFKHKPVMLMSVSERDAGGFHGLSHLRDVLGDLKMHVLPEMLLLSDAGKAFGRANKVKDATLRERVAVLVEELVLLTDRLGA